MRFKRPFILKLQFLSIGIGLTLLSTCITPLDVEPSEIEDVLVVQGFINDDFGPHDFRITQVAKFTGVSEGGTVSIIEGAEVRIIDQNGQSVSVERVSTFRKDTQTSTCTSVFVEVTTDYRTPESFKGEIGHTYTLEITTREGETYKSEPQTMLPTPPIDSLQLAFKELPSLNQIIPESGVEVFASWLDPPEENFYFWRINGTYNIRTPDKPSSTVCCLYDPRDGEAENCWIVEKNIRGNELAFSDQRVNGQEVTQMVGLIKDDGLRFADKAVVSDNKLYHVQVEQYMIPQKAFEFNEKAKTLGSINGEIFDPPPLSIKGNIFNINDSTERVIGYFGAYAKQTKEIFIPRSLLKFTQFFPSPCGDCRIRAGAQTEIPEPYL